MPSTATAPKSTAPKARKPRARKATAKKPQVSKVTVTSYQGGKVVAKVTTLKRPSSARLISGLFIKALAIAMRWFSPPDSSVG